MKRIAFGLVLVFFLLLLAADRTMADGNWAYNGISVTVQPTLQYWPLAISDGSGGVMCSYIQGAGPYSIMMQRLNSHGDRLWLPSGNTVCASTVWTNIWPAMIPDGSGGAILSWFDNTTSSDIYAQRMTGAGTPVWGTNGRQVTDASNYQRYVSLAPDGSGGAVMAWGDMRTYTTTGSDIYAQHLDPGGAEAWVHNGVTITASPDYQIYTQALSDGLGGAFIFWTNTGQHIDASGNTLWVENGLALNSPGAILYNPLAVTMTANTFLLVYQDDMLGGDIHANQYSFQGVPLWGEYGVTLCAAANSQKNPQVAKTGSDAVIVWEDSRSGNSDIYAQKIDAGGAHLWAPDGVPVCVAVGAQSTPYLIAREPDHGVIVTWSDNRSGTSQIYAQRLSPAGEPLWQVNGVPLSASAGSASLTGPCMVTDRDGGAIVIWLETNASQTTVKAQRIFRPFPAIASVAPASAPWGKALRDVQITGYSLGDEYGQATYVKLTRSAQTLTATRVRVQDSHTLLCDLDFSTTATSIGDWYPVIYDSLGQTSNPTSAALHLYQPKVGSVSVVSSTADKIYTGTQDNLMLQLNVAGVGYDYLNALTVENLDTTAKAGMDISHLYLWHKAGGGTDGSIFNPQQATRIAELTAGTNDTWSCTLHREVSPGDAFYITADIPGSARVGTATRFALPKHGAHFEFGGTFAGDYLISLSRQEIRLAVTLTLGLLQQPPANVVHGQTGVALGRVGLNNISGATLTINSLKLSLLDSSGRAHPLHDLFSRLAITTGAITASADDDLLFTLGTSLTMTTSTSTFFDISGDLLGSSSLDRFRLGFQDGNAINQAGLLAQPAENQSFPLLFNTVNFREPQLDAVFHSYPNPFRAGREVARIPYYLGQSGHVRLAVLTLAKELVATVLDADQPAGMNETTWNGRNQQGHTVVSGIYWLRIETSYADGSRETLTRKLAVVR